MRNAKNFSVSKKEMETLTNYLDEHIKTCKLNSHSSQIALGYISFMFTEGPIGTEVRAVCRCQKIMNITDYDSF